MYCFYTVHTQYTAQANTQMASCNVTLQQCIQQPLMTNLLWQVPASERHLQAHYNKCNIIVFDMKDGQTHRQGSVSALHHSAAAHAARSHSKCSPLSMTAEGQVKPVDNSTQEQATFV